MQAIGLRDRIIESKIEAFLTDNDPEDEELLEFVNTAVSVAKERRSKFKETGTLVAQTLMDTM